MTAAFDPASHRATGTDAPAVSVVGMDHVVLTVADVERSLRFYVDELGLEPERVEEWRRAEAPFPSVRIDEGTIIDLFAASPTGPDAATSSAPRLGNLDHLCLVVAPTDLDAIARSGRFEVVDGPARRWGARGDGTSLYVLDPDGNVVELRYYA